MLVDHEKVLLELKRVLSTKPSHGADALLAEVARLEARHQLEEGLPERALRLYGVVFSDSTRPAQSRPSLDVADGTDDQPASIGAGPHRPEEDNHHATQGSTDRGRARRAGSGVAAAA